MELLLPILIIIFIAIIGFIIYANWPSPAAAVTPEQTCQSCGAPPKQCGCRPPPCGRCGMPKPQCGCPMKAGCAFC